MIKVLIIFGTRPEAIKFAPLIKTFQRKKDIFSTRVCITSQHKEMLLQVLSFFEIFPDIDIDVMQPNQNLSSLSALILSSLHSVLDDEKPDVVFVQGDTTTAFIGALAAFYKKIPVAHLEAGLRSFDKYSPYPEEVNRKLISSIATYHFAATQNGKDNLIAEAIHENISVTGNTVVDALLAGLQLIQQKGETPFLDFFSFLNFDKKIILVTGHRRESLGAGFEQICNALRTISESYPEVQIVYPVHLNPNVQEPVNRLLGGLKNIYLLPPLSYEHIIWLMSKSYIILTDSGGIQEEAPSLGKPILVMRSITERMEGVRAGTAKLVGAETSSIINSVEQLLTDENLYAQMSTAGNPYGDGKASERITEIIYQQCSKING